jgi:hypothetical protein
MDNALFEKYKKTINKKIEEKQKIIDLIKKETKIIIKEDQIILKNKKINLIINSTQKMKLKLNNIYSKLEQIGYKLIY